MTQPIAPGQAGLLGFGDGDTWESRIRDSAYTSPSGVRVEFQYEAVSREVELRGTAWDFPNVSEQYVQRTGFGSRQYPLRCIFSGPQHDRVASVFEAMLLEAGAGRLEHPLYGPVTVVPFGRITRREDLKNEANQTIIEVTFWSTILELYPTAQQAPQNEILTSLDDADIAAAEQFDSSTVLETELDRANAKAAIRKAADTTSGAMQAVASKDPSVARGLLDVKAEVTLGLDVLIDVKATLAARISAMVRVGGTASGSIQARLDAYGSLQASLFASDQGQPASALTSGTALAIRSRKIANDFHITDHFAGAALAGAINAVARHRFTTKPEAISAASAILAQFDDYVIWRDAGFEALETIPRIEAGQLDTGEAIQGLQQAVADTAGFLIRASFSLVPERIIVLDRPRTIVDLTAELYGTIDEKLDFMIASNDLTGEEILELPRGKRIRYYV